MAKRDPMKVAKKWASRTSGAVESYRDGVMSVDEAPGLAAARKEATMRQRTMEAIDSGKWRENTAAVTKEEWQRKSSSKGAANLATGVREAENEMAQGFANLADDWDRIRKEIRSMPNSTDAERRARWERSQELMKQLKGKFKKGRR